MICMKKLVILFALFSFLASCSKENDTSGKLPQWLQDRIAADEKEIAADPQSGKDLGAWIEYTYQDSTFFEYHNLLMSSLPKVYHFSGIEINYILPEYTEYQNGKCCKKFVWKGKSYIED
jgi:hypothetical protein